MLQLPKFVRELEISSQQNREIQIILDHVSLHKYSFEPCNEMGDKKGRNFSFS